MRFIRNFKFVGNHVQNLKKKPKKKGWHKIVCEMWYLQKRRAQLADAGVEEQYLELLDAARKEREAIEDEITVLRQRTVSTFTNYAYASL